MPSIYELNEQTGECERFITIKEAATALGIPYFKVQRAAQKGLIPTYWFFNSRKLVKYSEVVDVISASRSGGSND